MQNGNDMDKEPITLNGLNKLKEELIFLKEKIEIKVIIGAFITIIGTLILLTSQTK